MIKIELQVKVLKRNAGSFEYAFGKNWSLHIKRMPSAKSDSCPRYYYVQVSLNVFLKNNYVKTAYYYVSADLIYLMCRIFPGEELTYDYKFPFEEEKLPCHCGSKKCRKYLN